ncbi:hypothetical protein OG765_29075 [Streptomyces sp. NBC_00555]|uniref:hypothetical protein n=1 Tax=Streptomyces sp. NBC_00555 TaxID=2903662 RepID=UPI0022596A7C|nr:hypothetical protein [Streptomyces sp. NBC_00555]MCX5014994.1 hypothetical protein [Streptomyces sp. NBC_00555]
MKSKKLGTLLVGMAIAMGGVAVTATPAAASTPCTVERHGETWLGHDWVDVTNGCYSDVRVKVIWNYAHDSSCKTIPAYGGTVRFSPSVSFGTFNRTESC